MDEESLPSRPGLSLVCWKPNGPFRYAITNAAWRSIATSAWSTMRVSVVIAGPVDEARNSSLILASRQRAQSTGRSRRCRRGLRSSNPPKPFAGTHSQPGARKAAPELACPTRGLDNVEAVPGRLLRGVRRGSSHILELTVGSVMSDLKVCSL